MTVALAFLLSALLGWFMFRLGLETGKLRERRAMARLAGEVAKSSKGTSVGWGERVEPGSPFFSFTARLPERERLN